MTPDHTGPQPSPTVDEFLAASAADSNAWWRLGSGDHLNLFDEAIEQRDRATADRDAFQARAEMAEAALALVVGAADSVTAAVTGLNRAVAQAAVVPGAPLEDAVPPGIGCIAEDAAGDTPAEPVWGSDVLSLDVPSEGDL